MWNNGLHQTSTKRTTSDMGLEAATKALLDAGITFDQVEAAYTGYCYGDTCSGQRALYNLGLTGIPITNVNNACCTGSTALYQANMLVKSGMAECALALGFEQMAPGSLTTPWKDREPPISLWTDKVREFELATGGSGMGPDAPRLFGNAARNIVKSMVPPKEHLSKIASKNHQHGSRNPYSQFRVPWTPEQVAQSPQVTDELTLLMCSPTSDGAACCIVASEKFVHAHKLENQAIEFVAQSLATDMPSTFESASAMELVGYSMTKRVADEAFSQAGFAPGTGRDEVGVVELHDCFSSNELITYDALGLCKPGEAHKLVDAGDNTVIRGKYVINPSGGLEAKGHPLGATGLGMHFYIATQLRGWAGQMQSPNLMDHPDPRGKLGLVHNLGLGGAAVVSLMKRPEFWDGDNKREDGRNRVGYNHGQECRPITMEDIVKVRSRQYSPTVLEQARL
ncbi:hypothetical protein BS47DRAFT_1330736 [Hydnum rufescens UP504]|uniref:Sterol carrier protein 2 n=1 Tax=Hydnum rufescens UP504 TaxID=1448309 RepID=A0A9P6ATT7_9AGAM|nr:hypothetical protein BS47DRAFT_1330736 [Hydnum rufescens UP504]